MNIAYVLVQSTIGHEMEVLSDLLKLIWSKRQRALLAIMIFLLKLRHRLKKKLKGSSQKK